MCFAPFVLQTHRTAFQLPPQKVPMDRGCEGLRLVKRAKVDVDVDVDELTAFFGREKNARRRELRAAGPFHKVFYLMENLSIVENGVN